MNARIAAGLMVLGVVVATTTISARAEVHEWRVPLREGKLQTSQLTAALTDEMHLSSAAASPLRGWLAAHRGPEINLSGVRGNLFVNALNAALGDGGSITQD